TVGYIFIWMLIASIPPGVNYALTTKDQDMSVTMFMLQFFVFYYAIFALMGSHAISVLAAISLAIGKWLRRKLAYQQLWKMTVFAATIPMMLFTLAEGFHMTHWLVLVILIVLILTILIRMILIFPKQNIKRHTVSK